MADGQARGRLVDGRLPDRCLRLPQQSGQYAHAVLRRIGRQILAEQVRAGGEEVVQANHLVAQGTGLYLPRPTSHERLPVSTLVDAALVVPQRFIASTGRPVVTGRNKESVLVLSIALQGLHDLAQHIVALVDPVAIFAFFALHTALAHEFLRRDDRAVGRADRKIEKERLVLLGPLIEILQGLLDHHGLVLDRLHVSNRLVLLDDRTDVAGMGESIEIVEA